MKFRRRLVNVCIGQARRSRNPARQKVGEDNVVGAGLKPAPIPIGLAFNVVPDDADLEMTVPYNLGHLRNVASVQLMAKQ
jgi:hypothetical protein